MKMLMNFFQLIGINMRKVINDFTEFKRIINRTYLKGYEVCYTSYGFYYRTKKCDFFYSCRSLVDRLRVFELLRDCNVKHYKLEEVL